MSETKTTTAIAKADDGTIQITFTIPKEEIESARNKAVSEMSKEVSVPGFRPGKAPDSETEKRLDPNKILEKTLGALLPKLFAETVKKENIKPAIYPKFEIISAKEGEDWQLRAITCEVPNIELGDYKKDISGALRAQKIWIPGKNGKPDGKKPEDKSENQARLESELIKTLLGTIKVKLPKILIQEEVNARLSKLLERIEKLGLSLDSYLASVGKDSKSLRTQYETQAIEAISLDLILTKIAESENLSVDPKDIELAISASKADPKLAEELATPERRSVIENILKRRKALDFLKNL